MGSAKSCNMEDKPVFKNRFQRCTPKVREIFNELRDRSISECESNDWGYSNKPDLRIGLKYNMIVLVPKSNHVLVMLRIDEQFIDVTTQNKFTSISLYENSSADKPGTRWIEFQVLEKTQMNDAIELIVEVYNRREKAGW